MRFPTARPIAKTGTLRVSALALVVASLLAACAEDPQEPPVPATVEVVPETVGLTAISDTAWLRASVFAADGTEIPDAQISWENSDGSVATVTASGLVTAIGNGSATVSAVSGSLSAAAAITVAQDPSHLDLSADSLGFASLQDTVQLNASVSDRKGHPVLSTSVIWDAGDTAVVAVSEEGTVVSRGNGATFVYARANGLADSVAVSVRQVAANIAILGDTIRFLASLGDETTIRAEAVDSNGFPVDDTLEFRLDHGLIGTLSDDGVYRGLRRGWNFVEVSLGEKTARVEVAVDPWLAVHTGFEQNGATYGDMVMIRPDGSDAYRLAEGTGISIGPEVFWSSDGEWIYFHGLYPSTYPSWGVYRMHLSTRQPELLFTTYGAVGISLSPSREELAFVEEDWDGSTQIMVYRLRILDLTTNESRVLAEDTSYSGGGD